MNACLPQKDFADYAAAWATFIASASAAEVQQLFRAAESKLAQLFVSFDLRSAIIPLLSTVGIELVRTRFVLLPAGPSEATRFGLAIYAADAQGGRISAYYLGTSGWTDLVPQLKTCEPLSNSSAAELKGLVPFDLAKSWVCNWCWAVEAQALDAAAFATSYGPLQGYDFELGDFLDPLFQMQNPEASAVRAVFGLKRYYPAYPENLEQPTSTFELVMRLYSPKGSGGNPDVLGGNGGGPSYDQSTPNPPGI